MKKLLITFLSVSFLFIFVCNFTSIKADAKLVVVKENTEKILDGGIIYNNKKVDTQKEGQSTYTLNNINSFTLSADNDAARLVSWSYANKYGTTLVTLDKIAEDYEKNHPGWIVVGGINAEGYHSNGSRNEISNMFAQDGELMRTGVSNELFKELFGFMSDGTYTIKRVPELTDNMILSLKDENKKTISKLDVKLLNELPLNNDIAIITRENKTVFDFTNYYVVECDTDMYRYNTFYITGTAPLTDTDDGIFAKGPIVKAFDPTTDEYSESKFYFVTKDKNSFDQILSAKYASCQYEFVDEFKDAESVFGYMYKLVENGYTKLTTDLIRPGESPATYSQSGGYYTTTSKQRAGIGFKEDGSIVLLTANVEKGGPNQYELGNIFKDYGCINAYQFDGGGSVTSVARDEFGNIQLLNDYFGDGNFKGYPRSISTGVFFVCKKNDIIVGQTSRFTLDVTVPEDSILTNPKIVIDNRTIELSTGKNTIEGLEEDTEYPFHFTYSVPSHLDENILVSTNSITHVRKTDPYVPEVLKLEFDNIGKNSLSLSRKDDNPNISNVIIYLGSKEYVLGNETSIKINNLIDGGLYKIKYKYTSHDVVTSKDYIVETETSEVKLPEVDMPYLETFEVEKAFKDGKITFAYKIVDPDRRLITMYLSCNGEDRELTLKAGSERFTKIESSTTATLYIFFTNEQGKTEKKVLATYDIEVEEIPVVIPTIDTFNVTLNEDTKRYVLVYSITDTSSVITSIKLSYDNKEIALSELSNTITLDELSNDTTVSLIVEYQDKEDSLEIKQSKDVQKVKEEVVEPDVDDNDDQKDPIVPTPKKRCSKKTILFIYALNAISLLLFVFKKKK